MEWICRHPVTGADRIIIMAWAQSRNLPVAGTEANRNAEVLIANSQCPACISRRNRPGREPAAAVIVN